MTKPKFKKILLLPLAIPLFLGSIALFEVVFFDIYINRSPSIEMGLYRSIEKPSLTTGNIVAYKIDNNIKEKMRSMGITSYDILFKYVMAVPGDSVCWDAGEVKVNGNTALENLDLSGTSFTYYPSQCITLSNEQVVLGVPGNARSFDSRLFGPATISHIENVITKL